MKKRKMFLRAFSLIMCILMVALSFPTAVFAEDETTSQGMSSQSGDAQQASLYEDAQESGLDREFIADIDNDSPAFFHSLYLSTEVIQRAVVAQDRVIKMIADRGSCVIVGRAADHVLRDYDNVVNIFIYAPEEYRIGRIMEVYGDTYEQAKKQIHRSDDARSSYYKKISGKAWGNRNNYNLMVDSSIGIEDSVELIVSYITNSTD